MEFVVRRSTTILPLVLLMATACSPEESRGDVMLFDRVEHHSVDNDGVNIHYVTLGEGPRTLLFVHGAPDFWYLWNNQLNALCEDYKCVAMDTRGYNRSDKPEGVENYSMELLTSDIAAVADDVGGDDVTLNAHDFGGLVAWNFAMDDRYKSKVDRLAVLNVTHPRGFSRALANQTPEQAEGSAYARILVDPEQEAAAIELLAGAIELRMTTWWNDQDPAITEFVNEANARTSVQSIAHWYQANYFRQPYKELSGFPQVEMPVLQIHGLADPAVTKEGLADTWDWVDGEYTLVTYPGVGHIPHLQVPERVNAALRSWLESH